MRCAMKEVKCAFCHGVGRDPFGLLSPLAACQVCGSKGKVAVQEPVKVCAFCEGTGVYPGSRLTCTVCHGTGVVQIVEPVTQCPSCHGSGKEPDSGLPCLLCKGKGVITVSRR